MIAPSSSSSSGPCSGSSRLPAEASTTYVVNDPIAKREVFGYYKLAKQITRAGEVGELERQWNSVA